MSERGAEKPQKPNLFGHIPTIKKMVSVGTNGGTLTANPHVFPTSELPLLWWFAMATRGGEWTGSSVGRAVDFYSTGRGFGSRLVHHSYDLKGHLSWTTGRFSHRRGFLFISYAWVSVRIWTPVK